MHGIAMETYNRHILFLEQIALLLFKQNQPFSVVLVKNYEAIPYPGTPLQFSCHPRPVGLVPQADNENSKLQYFENLVFSVIYWYFLACSQSY